MHVHRFEKLWIGLSLLLIAAFIGIVIFGFTVMDLKVPGVETGNTVDPATLDETAFAQPGVHQVDDNHYEVYMLARQFLFQPGTGTPLTLPAEAKITFHLTSPDVIHGFEIVGTNVNAMAIPGQISTFATRFPEPGIYDLICHEYCGPAHHNMQGQIEIVPPSEFDESSLISQ